VGEEPNHTTAIKPAFLLIIHYSLGIANTVIVNEILGRDETENSHDIVLSNEKIQQLR
jgi:hypothetical protein